MKSVLGSRTSRRLVGSLLALGLAIAALGTTLPTAAAATPACPTLSAAALTSALGVKPLSIATRTADVPKLWTLNCFYTLGAEPSLTFEVYKGTVAFSSLKATIDETIGTDNANANSEAPGTCKPTKSGQCSGGTYDAHESALAGLGERAYTFPGNESGGALAVFVWKDDTFVVQSSGPYGVPGPTLARVLAFARLVIRSGFSLGS